MQNSSQVLEDFKAPKHWPDQMVACTCQGHSPTGQASSLHGRNPPHPHPDHSREVPEVTLFAEVI